MLEKDRILRNQTLLQEIYPATRPHMAAVIQAMESLGYRPRLQQAWRSASEQMTAYNNGFSKVTYGFHNVTGANGAKEALAADIIDDDRPLTTKTDFMLHLVAAAEKNGLTTGVRWGLSDVYSKAVDSAIAAQTWTVPIHVGWDPLHVEVSGMTIQNAKSGKRPDTIGQGTTGSTGTSTSTTGSSSGTGTTTNTGDNTTAFVKRHFSITETGKTQVKEYDLSNSLRPVTLLPVPYVSQLGAGADAHSNDCGAASTVMMLRAYQKTILSPDDFYTNFGLKGDVFLSVTQLRNAMSSVGLQTEFQANLAIQDIFNSLVYGKPTIVLIKYGTLVNAGLTEKTFQGPHFAVVVGLDTKYIYLHDPLYTDPTVGEAHAYPIDIFWKAWKDVATDPALPNPERSMVIPTLGIGFQVLRKVKVTLQALNVRNGPGLNNPVVGNVKAGDVLDVTREMNGWGEIGFNRWISLTYTVTVLS